MAWFKNEFFTYKDCPDCTNCGNGDNMKCIDITGPEDKDEI